MKESNETSKKAAPISEDQWADSQVPRAYNDPIEKAVTKCADYIISNVSSSPLTAFTCVDGKWQMVIPPVSDFLKFDDTSYSFTLSITLECEGYKATQSSFTYSRLKFFYSFGLDDFATSYHLGQTSTDNRGRINDRQIYGDATKTNTQDTLTQIVRPKMTQDFTRGLKSLAQSMLCHELHTKDDKAKSKNKNARMLIARQLMKLAKQLMEGADEE